ncbi:MAG: alpha/beta fold hydrolase [Promethearchaeota archaeon]
MPYFENGNAMIYYEDVGSKSGESIISNHGLSEDCNYWNETGVTARLSEQYRVISIDMRAHGRSKLIDKDKPHGYDADTMADDFDALADHLGIDKFHLLSHATGGMVAVRYAMTRSKRLLSLILTDTSSNTLVDEPPYREFTKEEIEEAKRRREAWENATDEEREIMMEDLLNITVEERMAQTRQEPGPYLFRFKVHPDGENMFKIYDGFLRRQDRREIMTFMGNFYTDPDPRIEQLRKIKCPTLVLLGEYDIVFLKPCEIMAREIPDVRHVIMKDLGHMTAIESPERFIAELLDFLNTVKQTGRANR